MKLTTLIHFSAALTVALLAPLTGIAGQLRINVVDAATGQPICARITVTGPGGKEVKAPGALSIGDSAYFRGTIPLRLPNGEFTFVVERGPEYLPMTGKFTMQDFTDGVTTITLRRHVDMAARGWYSGDLDFSHTADATQRAILLEAEDLHLLPVITWTNRLNPWGTKPLPAVETVDGNRFISLSGGEDKRLGGRLTFFNLAQPLELRSATPEYPTPLEFAQAARASDGFVDASQPLAWDLPAWLAPGAVDAIQVLDRTAVSHDDTSRLATEQRKDWKAATGLAHNWTVYTHLLNCGLRLPPSAGSGCGVTKAAPGQNRAYVFVEGQLTYDAWWKALKQGRVVVTSGPLLDPRVDGQLPGHVFKSEGPLTLTPSVSLFTRSTSGVIEVWQNGQKLSSMSFEKFAASKGQLPPVTFQESGWLVIRVVADNPRRAEVAFTGPYYVEIDGKPHVSRRSALFFETWTKDRAPLVKVTDPPMRAAVMKTLRAAYDYWHGLAERATAD